MEQLREIHASSCYNELLALSQKSSLLTRIEQENKEIILSKFIKNVLNDFALNKSLPVAPMGFLLRYVASKKFEMGQHTPLNIALLTSSNINVETSFIETEFSIPKSGNGKKGGKIDIFAKGKVRYYSVDKAEYTEELFCIVIENKIKIKQHSDQCQRYWNSIEREYKKDIQNRYYVYLDPKEGIASCDAYINMSYNNFMYHILDPLLSEIKHLGDKIPQDYQRDLNELIDTLQHPSDFMSNQPIALSKEYKELLSSFYKDNKELILLAAKECAEEDDFAQIKSGYDKRNPRRKYIIEHPKLQEKVEVNQKTFLEALLLQYDKLGRDFKWIEDKFKIIGKFYVSPTDSTTGYGEPVTIGGARCKINIDQARKDRNYDRIVTIAEKDGFKISEI